MNTYEIRNVRVLQVVQVEHIRGEGTEEDPVRMVMSYWTEDNLFLAERDELEKYKAELYRKDESLREAGDMLKESRYAVDFATNYGYKSGTLRNDIEAFLSLLEMKKVMEGA